MLSPKTPLFIAKRRRTSDETQVVVPNNLTALSKTALIELVRSLESERKSKRAKMITPTAAAQTMLPEKTMSPKNIAKLKAKMAKQALSKLKKVKIATRSAKPTVEINEGMTYDDAKAIISNIGTQTKSTTKMFVVKLTGEDIRNLLPDLPAEAKVIFSDYRFKRAFGSGKCDRPMEFEDGEFKYTHSSKMLTLKIRVAYNSAEQLRQALASIDSHGIVHFGDEEPLGYDY